MALIGNSQLLKNNDGLCNLWEGLGAVEVSCDAFDVALLRLWCNTRMTIPASVCTDVSLLRTYVVLEDNADTNRFQAWLRCLKKEEGGGSAEDVSCPSLQGAELVQVNRGRVDFSGNDISKAARTGKKYWKY
jgi:hypothetical protein